MYDSAHTKYGNGMVSYICCFDICAGWDSSGSVANHPRSPATKEAADQGKCPDIKRKRYHLCHSAGIRHELGYLVNEMKSKLSYVAI